MTEVTNHLQWYNDPIVMRVIEPVELYRWERKRRRGKNRRRTRSFVVFLVVLLMLFSAAYYRYQRPYQAPVFTARTSQKAVAHPKIVWPSYGQSAVGTTEDGVLASQNADKPVPIASVAKVITVLTILDKKPLNLHQQGPEITLTSTDEVIYHDYIAKGGSVSGVTAGRKITEYESLQAILLPSSNNMADTLVNWAFGSQEAYLAAAKVFLHKNGLHNTTVSDASGFSPQTVSTADDLVKIGIIAMKNPVLSEVFSQKSANIEVAGTLNNVNRLLGVDGIVGIKTGNTDQAGGCYLVAAERTLSDGQKKTIIAAVLGANTLSQAAADSRPLLNQVVTNYKPYVALTAGQQLGVVQTAWGQQSAVLAADDVTFYGWGNADLSVQTKVSLSNLAKNSNVGTATVHSSSESKTVPLTLSSDIPAPSQLWRLGRIFTL